MAEFHFVEDYVRFVRGLLATRDIDTAMSEAVGGQFEQMGKTQLDIMRFSGLRDGHRMFDLGCGSGRLSTALGKEMRIEYSGSDVVQELLDYAKKNAPKNYKFILHKELSIPESDSSCDFVSAFSVFTHLLHEETYIYIHDILRVLKPGGQLVFSFLEFAAPAHWTVFEHTIAAKRSAKMPPLNQFIERSVVDVWCRMLECERVAVYGGHEAPWRGGVTLGQSVAILRKAAW